MADDLINYVRIMDRLTDIYGTLPTKAATIAVNFSKERFRAQNWVDNNTEPWKKRKVLGKTKRSNSRKILVKTARLMRSIRKISANNNYAVIGTDVPYAQIHNDGGRFLGTANVRTSNRKAFSRKRAGRTEQVKASTVKAHSRKVNLRMPRRRFIGQSSVLNTQIERMITAEIIKAIKG